MRWNKIVKKTFKVPLKNDFVAHIFAKVWAIYWQYMGHTAQISAVYRQYVALAHKPNVGHTVSHVMSKLVQYFFFLKCSTRIMWENYGPYSAKALEPHKAHTLPTIFFLPRLTL